MSSILDALGGGPGGPAGAPLGQDPLGGGGQLGPDAGGGGVPGPDSEQVRQLILKAIDNLDEAKSLEGDEADQSILAKLISDAHKFLGDRQKQDEAAAGITPAHKAMSRAYQGQ